MTRSQIRKYAFIKSIPIMCSYIFVSMAYGIMMEDAGFKWYYSLLVSLTVYTGAFQLCAQLRVCSQAGGNPVYPRFSQPDNSESWDDVGNGI